MNKPRWKQDLDGGCQWPRCRNDGETHFIHGSTKWIDLEEGVDLCDEHHAKMNEEIYPDLVCPVKVGSRVWIAEMEDWPREQVYVRDWFVAHSCAGKILLLVSDDLKTELDDCEEIDLSMLEGQ